MSTEGQLTLADLEPEAGAVEVPVASPRPEPTPEQATAVAARRRDAFLEAGAGTGKTTVLVDRYCAALVDDGVEVDRLLAFTFTERAAAEMRTRIRAELGRRSRAARAHGDHGLADQLLGLARATERAWVMTIHAFCRRLLAAHPLAAGLDPAFRVLDANQAARLRDRAFRTALDELLAAGDHEVARAAAAYEPWRLTAMTIAAHERLRSQGMSDPELPPVGDPIRARKPGEEPEQLSPAEAEAAVIARAAIERLLERFHDRYEAAKDERSALDFSDLELRALALLKANPVLAASWRARFDHVMVDEFQDTNRVQLDLVEALRGPETKVFMVGDEHQSIYRFRNADLEVFRREREAAAADPDRDVLPLLGNFRSRPAGARCGQRGRPRPAGRLRRADRRAHARRRARRGRAAADARRGQRPRGAPAGTRRGSSSSPGAERLAADGDRRGAGAGRAPARAGRVRRREARARSSSCCAPSPTSTPTRTRSSAPACARTWSAGAATGPSSRSRTCIRLLGVVANPLDDEYLFGALASFANGVSPDALWLLRQAARGEGGGARHVWPLLEWRFGDGREPEHAETEWLDHIDPEDVQRLRAVLRDRRRAARRGAVADARGAGRADDERLRLRPRADRPPRRRGPDGERAQADAPGARLRGERGTRPRAAFSRSAAESTERDEREGMAAVQAEGHDGVRVMTVHAAKGLRVPGRRGPRPRPRARRRPPSRRPGDRAAAVAGRAGARRFGMRLVFPSAKSLRALGAHRPERGRGRRRGRGGLPADLRRCLARRGPADPQRRLPAERRSSPPSRRSRATRRCAACCPCSRRPAGTAARRSSPCPARGRSSRPTGCLRPRSRSGSPSRGRNGPPSSCGASTPPPEPEPLAGVVAPPPLVEARAAPVPVGHLSYSALALYERCGYRFYVERVLGAREPLVAGPASADDEQAEPEDELAEPEVPRRLALGIGNAVHAALEWSARRGWARPPDELIERLLAGEGLSADRAAGARAAALVAAWLDSALCRELGNGAGLRPEVPFVLGLGPTVLRGQIDLLAESADALPTVIDYKTDALDGREPAELAERYAAQREVYALAAGDRGARVLHVFLEAPDRPVEAVIGADELDGVRARLERIVERMRTGEFDPTPEPYAALCHGCPAAARLCPHPKWRPQDVSRLAVFGYASLVSPASAAHTLGRPVDADPRPPAGLDAAPGRSAATTGPRRRPSPARTAPMPRLCLGLNLEPDARWAAPERGPDRARPSAELDRLDLREIRYRRVEVTDSVSAADPRAAGLDLVSHTSRVPSITARLRRPTPSSSPPTR